MENYMIAGMTYYQILWYFVIYSLIGWIIEVIFHAITLGKVMNRGFLNGPLCPVYGFGMLTVLAASNIAESSGLITLEAGSPQLKTTVLLFLGGMLLSTSIELIAGWLLDACFHMRWWDYSRERFNLHGYICLRFSIIWGLGITLAVYLVHPLMSLNGKSALKIPEKYGWPVLVFLYLILLADFIVTVAIVIGLNRKLTELDKLSESMRVLSDRMSETIGTSTIKTSQKIGEGQVQAALAKAEFKDAVTREKDKVLDKVTSEKEDWAIRYAQLENRAASLKKEIFDRTIFHPGRIISRLPLQKFTGSKKILAEFIERYGGH